MQRFLPVFLLTTAIYLSGSAQTKNTVQLVDSLITQGKYNAAIVHYEFPQDIKVLQNKTLENLKKDPKWSDKYIVHMVEVGDRELHYVDGMGLTSGEFNKLLDAFKKGRDVVLSDTFSLEIKESSDILTFHATGKAAVFNKLRIDLKKFEITFENMKLTREVKAVGQKDFAPKLQGFEAHGSQKYKEDKPGYSIGSFGLCVGVNLNEKRPLLCLMRFLKSATVPDFLSIVIL